MFKLRHKTLKDQKRREQFKEVEMTRNLYNAIIHSSIVPSIVKVYAQEKLYNLPVDSAFVRIRNRCIMTSRPRGVIGQYNINRIKFRELVLQGKISGVKLR
uniref:Ribosomal protein S14 n=1 Tax=Capsaspora owczarzaki TaxID=192875 RepID=M1K4J6_9EUKA|nr:ribosomal protein S14 [Capsaspora owczarzaki]